MNLASLPAAPALPGVPSAPGANPSAGPAAEGAPTPAFARLLQAVKAGAPRQADDPRSDPAGTATTGTTAATALLARAGTGADAQPEAAASAQDDLPAAEEAEGPGAPADASALLAGLLVAPARAPAAAARGDVGGDPRTEARAAPRTELRADSRAEARAEARAPSATPGPGRNTPGLESPTPGSTAQADTTGFAEKLRALESTALPTAPAAAAAGAASSQAAPLPAPAADAPRTGADPRIAEHVQSPAFPGALGAELSLLVKEGVHEARLQLHPAEMGPITVQIQLDGQNAQVTLSAEQALTRERLEQALPALAGALQDNGLTLTGGGVFQQPRQAPERQAPERQAQAAGSGKAAGLDGTVGAEGAAPAMPAAVRQRVAAGGVDLYA